MVVASLGALGAALVGCGLDAGGQDLGAFDPDGSAIPGIEAGVPFPIDASFSDSDSGPVDPFDAASAPPDTSTGPGVDAAPAPTKDGSAGCVPTAEVCNDGIDNDCNGKIDCADVACTAGFVCAPPVPAGWSLVEYAAATRPSCGAGFGAAEDVVEGPAGAAATCACGCAMDPNDPGSCEKGTAKLFSNGALGGCVSLTSLDFPAADGACSPKPLDSVANAKAQIAPLPYTPGKCTPAPSKTVAPVTFAGQGRACASALAPGGGCGSASVCAPRAAAPFGMCVEKVGDVACPAGFATRHLAGTGASDTRDCGACTCTVSGGCANAKLTLFEDKACGGGGGPGGPGGPGGATLAIVADGACNDTNETTSHKYTAYEYSADPQGVQCAGSPGAPSGAVALVGARTVCCL